MAASSQSPYSPDFYQWQQEGALASARAVCPLVQRLAPYRSVLDVGCGVGAWLKADVESGIAPGDAHGIDGPWARSAGLLFDAAFSEADLSSGVFPSVDRRFDLVRCLEVAEHLPDLVGDALVRFLCDRADVVLFSAAIPGQGGTDHINEQWPSHWAEKFERAGYRVFDVLRPLVWGDARVEWWYQQNLLLVMKSGLRPRLDEAMLDRIVGGAPRSYVHPHRFEKIHAEVSKPVMRYVARRARDGLASFFSK